MPEAARKGRDRRKSARKSFARPLEVMDRNSGRVAGRVVDISLDGLMVESDQEIPVNHIFQFSIALSPGSSEQTTLELGADCLWCERASDLKRCWAGFQIIDISARDRQVLEQVVLA